MTGHKIFIRRDFALTLPLFLIKRCVRAALRHEGVSIPCEVSVLITDDKGIQKLNRKYRNIKLPTDVLSFPMQVLVPGNFQPDLTPLDPLSGLLPLGDIILSAERVKAQAAEYGHSLRRETAYLVVHSVLHLLGYDHVDESVKKKQMRLREEVIIRDIGLL